MKKFVIIMAIVIFVLPAAAQWNSAKGKWATGIYVGSNFNPIGNKSYSWYQVSVRETRWLTNRIGIGAELGYTKITESSMRNPISANVFGKLRFFAGIYGEYGLGYAGIPYNGSNNKRGTYWAIGVSKKLGSHLALDLQYRNAPTPEILGKNYSNGLRAGLHFKF